MKSLIFCIITSFSAVAFAAGNESALAPAFDATDIQSEESFSLKDFKGKKVLLHFWAPSCTVCPAEVRRLSKLKQKLDPEKAAIVTVISFESLERSKKVVDSLDVTLPIGIDATNKIAADYGVKLLPVTFLIDEEGNFFKGPESYRFDGPKDWLNFEDLKLLRSFGFEFSPNN